MSEELVKVRIALMKAYKENTRLERSEILLERAIYVKCYECSGCVKVEIERCHIDTCPLHKFRLEGV